MAWAARVPISFGKPPTPSRGIRHWGRKIPGLVVASQCRKIRLALGGRLGCGPSSRSQYLGLAYLEVKKGALLGNARPKHQSAALFSSSKCPICRLEGDTLQTKLYSLQNSHPPLSSSTIKCPQQGGISVPLYN